jgi:hypothetical protein
MYACILLLGALTYSASGEGTNWVPPSELKIESTLEVLQGGSFYPSRKLLCGPLCLYVGARYLGVERYSIDDIAKMSAWNVSAGTTLLGLENACRKMGFHVQALQFPNVEELGQVMRRSAALAVIEDAQHFYLFTKIDNGQALMVSTPLQPQWITVEKLAAVWDGKALLFSKQPIPVAARGGRRLLLAGALCIGLITCVYLACRSRQKTRDGAVATHS